MSVKALAPIVFVAALCGCVGYGPSRGEGSPGYSESRRPDGAYLVRYELPVQSTEHTLLRAIERRARELCPHGHRVEDFERETFEVMHSMASGRDIATAVVRCGD